ncbi:hypothetical protein SeMB42_g06026 [Synchytrium endobioticum]|uniref:Uncharacterized protein n=1 Tax=Synchytrium endobioticum TaxID=286115 RepID=A0A507CFU3_9FUNG|nr:hypothetical protein SeMB42_g06026 [Synchytrium endobioticum]
MRPTVCRLFAARVAPVYLQRASFQMSRRDQERAFFRYLSTNAWQRYSHIAVSNFRRPSEFSPGLLSPHNRWPIAADIRRKARRGDMDSAGLEPSCKDVNYILL